MTRLIQKKLQNRIGTSLVETLATVLLLGIMGVALTAGIVAVERAYRLVVRKANEQVLLSTTIIEMRDIIRHSTEYREKDGKQYFCTDQGYWVEFISPTDKSGISVKYYMYQSGTDTFVAQNEGKAMVLVPVENGKISGIHSEFTRIAKAKDGVYTIQGLTVKGDNDNNGLKPIDYTIARFQLKTSLADGGSS